MICVIKKSLVKIVNFILSETNILPVIVRTGEKQFSHESLAMVPGAGAKGSELDPEHLTV